MTAVNDATISLTICMMQKYFGMFTLDKLSSWLVVIKCRSRNMSNQLDTSSFPTKLSIKLCCSCRCFHAGILFTIQGDTKIPVLSWYVAVVCWLVYRIVWQWDFCESMAPSGIPYGAEKGFKKQRIKTRRSSDGNLLFPPFKVKNL